MKKKLRTKVTSLLMAVVMTLTLLPTVALAEGKTASVDIIFTASSPDEIFIPRETMTVAAGTAAEYGYSNGAGVGADEVTILDAIVEAHVEKYGTDFTDADMTARKNYLEVSSSGFVITAFKTDASYSAQVVNGGPLGDETANTAVLCEGDAVENIYATSAAYGCDLYTYFALGGDQISEMTVAAGAEFDLQLYGDTAFSKIYPSYYGKWEPELLEDLSEEGTAELYAVDAKGNLGEAISGAIADDGTVTIPAQSAGDYRFTVMGYESAGMFPLIMANLIVHVTETTQNMTVDNAKSNLTWETIRSDNLRMNEVTSNLKLPKTYAGADIVWSCDDTTGALTPYNDYMYAYVERPAASDAVCTLTATITHGAASDTKTFGITVKAEGVTESQTVISYGDIMSGIAAAYTSSKTEDPWVVLDMENYNGTDVGDGGYTAAVILGTEAKYAISETAAGDMTSANKIIAKLKDTNQLSGSYYIYSIPYILMAYDAANTDTEGFATTGEQLVSAMVSYLENISSNYAGVDEVAPVISALSKYCSTNSEVKAAVNSAVSWLSAQQQSNGTFAYYGTSNAESTALAVTALAAVGIDAHTDSRFVKNDKSAVEGLMSFALANKTGFGHKGNVTLNTLATEQGFRALVAYARFKEKGAAYNIYTDGANNAYTTAVAAPAISATVPSDTGSGSSGSITVKVYIYGDTDHEASTVHVFKKDGGSGRSWVSNYSLEMKSGKSALYAIQTTLTKNDYTYNSKNGYISSVTTPGGETLSEFTNGENSGWLYMVNGVSPDVGASGYALSDGDKVTFYYTDDYSKEYGSESWGGSSDKKEETTITADTYSDVTLGDWYKSAVDYCMEKKLMNGMSGGKFSPDTDVSRAMAITTLWRLFGEKTAQNSGGYSDVESGKWYAAAVAWAKEYGIADGVGGGLFNPDGSITRAQLAVMLYRSVDKIGLSMTKTGDISGFADSGDVPDYAKDAMAWAYANGVITGKSGLLAPGDKATRAELATILMRFCEGNNL